MSKGYLNKVMLIGNLGCDPELKYTASGVPVCNFSLATSEEWTDKDGNKVEKTEWHRIIVWRKLAEVCAEYLKKGKKIYCEGQLKTTSWEKDGVKHYQTQIQMDNMIMLGGKDGQGGSQIPEPKDEDAPPPPYNEDTTDDDLPF